MLVICLMLEYWNLVLMLLIPYNKRMPQQIQPIRLAPPAQGKPTRRLHKEVLKQMVTLATSGFGLVAALAWNNVIQEVVNNYIKPYLAQGSGLLSLLLYAILITTLAVTVTYQLTKLVEKLENT